MSDIVTTARNARESLARGLSALQSDPNIPPAILQLAAPIAQAMGALHNIERSNGTQIQPHAEAALTNVRMALTALQSHPPTHANITLAMEAVASSLGLVHALSRFAGGAPAQPAPPAAVYAPPAPAPPQAAPVAPPPPVVARVPAGVPIPAPPAAPGAAVIEAALGTQSATNFYKGLSGNDIVDHGGLFVSTYKIPKIGTSIRIKVLLPGGYEFEANAVVRWAREQQGSSDEAPPGFGAQFTQIAPEARQLIYRYVRNREPLFHDDL